MIVLNISYWHIKAFNNLILPSASIDSHCSTLPELRIYATQHKCMKHVLRAGNSAAGSCKDGLHTAPVLKGQARTRKE